MTFFRDIKNSVFSFSFYKEAAGRSVAQAIRFLLVLVTLLTAVLTIRVGTDALRWIGRTANWMSRSLPEIRVVDGQANSPVQQPYQVEREGGDFVFVLDTTGSTTEIPKQYASGILITKTQLVLRENAFQKREYDLNQITGLVLNQETIARLEKTLKAVAFPLIAAGLFLYFFFARLLQVLFFSLITVVINLAGEIDLSYRQLFVAGIYALVPCSLLGMLVGLIGVPLLWFPAVYLSSYLAYLVMGVLQCKKA